MSAGKTPQRQRAPARARARTNPQIKAPTAKGKSSAYSIKARWAVVVW
jgi:hypothetical protein